MTTTVTANLHHLRTASGLQAKDLAALMGVHRQTIWRWEKGQTKPTDEQLRRLADIYRVSPDYLRGVS